MYSSSFNFCTGTPLSSTTYVCVSHHQPQPTTQQDTKQRASSRTCMRGAISSKRGSAEGSQKCRNDDPSLTMSLRPSCVMPQPSCVVVAKGCSARSFSDCTSYTRPTRSFHVSMTILSFQTALPFQQTDHTNERHGDVSCADDEPRAHAAWGATNLSEQPLRQRDFVDTSARLQIDRS